VRYAVSRQGRQINAVRARAVRHWILLLVFASLAPLPLAASDVILRGRVVDDNDAILCDLTDGEPTEVIICPDTAAGSRSTKGDQQVPKSDVEYIEDVFPKSPFKKSFSVVRYSSALRQRDRVNATQGLLKSGSLVVDPSCKYLVKDLENVRWLKDANGNTLYRLDSREPERLHQSDSADYAIRVITSGKYGPQGRAEPR